MKDNTARDMSYKFALRIIKLYKFLCKTKKEFELSKQILRSGTSIGANIEEAIGGHSEKIFLAKLSINRQGRHIIGYVCFTIVIT